MTNIELLYKRANDHLRAEDYIAWAIGKLEAGCDLPDVAILASLSLDAEPDGDEVERYFQNCVIEMDLVLVPDVWAGFDGYVKRICADIQTAQLTPQVGRGMLYEFWAEYEMYFFRMWGDLMDEIWTLSQGRMPEGAFTEGLTLANADEVTISMARQFSILLDRTLPKHFPSVWICTECAFADESVMTDTSENQNGCAFIHSQDSKRTCSCCGQDTLLNMRFFKNREMYLESGRVVKGV